MKKKIPWRGREFSVWATSVLWRYCFENVITLSQLSTLLSDCLTSGHWTFLLLKWPWHSYVYVFWRQLYFSLYSDPGICDLQLLVTQCSACSTAAANITSGIPNTRTFHFTHNIHEDKYIRQHFARKLNMQFPAIVAISRICNK